MSSDIINFKDILLHLSVIELEYKKLHKNMHKNFRRMSCKESLSVFIFLSESR